MLQIQVTPYIKKFIDHQLGNPVKLQNKTTSQILLRALLFQTSQLSLFAETQSKKVLPCTVYIDPPKTLDGQKGIASRLRLVNQFFECLFLEEMKRYIDQQPIKLNRRYRVSITNLNNGGCGWYAYYLSGKLPGSVIVSLRNGRHYMVFNGWGYCDSRGVWLPPVVWMWSYGDIEPVTREELRERLNGTGWNPAFDLADTVTIKSIINQ